MPKISIIIPCYNESENIHALYELIFDSLQQLDFECIYVNDGSLDKTFEKVMEIYETNDNIKVIDFSRNFGKEAAIYAGMKYAKGEYVAIMDADLQQSPVYISEMVNFLEENLDYDMVAMYQVKRKEESTVVSFLKHCFYKTINTISDMNLHENASDFRVLRKKVVKTLLDMPEYFRFSKGLFSWIGYKTFYLPYEANSRNAGQTKWTLGKLFKYGIGGVISFSIFPLRIALYLGVFISVAAIIYMIIVIIQHFTSGVIISGYTTIVCLILLLGGIQMLMLGVASEYIARLYIEGKHRPVYIAKNIYQKEIERSDNNDERSVK